MEKENNVWSTAIISVTAALIVFMISLMIIRFAPDPIAQRISACTVQPDNQYIGEDCVKER